MPYKNIEDRREAWKRWYKKHPDKKKERDRVQAQAISEHPERQICSIKYCNILGERHRPDYSKPKEILWLCKRHHEQVHHNRVCILCGDKHLALGYCNKHYKRFRNGKI